MIHGLVGVAIALAVGLTGIGGGSFNILNHTNFNAPNPVVYASATAGPSPTAGVITCTAPTSRQVQFGLKLLW